MPIQLKGGPGNTGRKLPKMPVIMHPIAIIRSSISIK
jgi:hypothetical protein